MIYTLTFNPAIDYVMRTSALKFGATNRSHSEEIHFGGKGVNVSCVLAALDVKSKALGFVAGFTGAALEEHLSSIGIDAEFVHLPAGNTRINVKLKGDCETEINAGGPDIPAAALAELDAQLDAIAEGDTLVIAGSVPSSLPRDIYEKIMQRLAPRGVKFAVDATGELLVKSLAYKPYLIKPNRDELSEIFGTEIVTDEEIVSAARKLRDMGAVNVLVSLGGDGAILVDEHDEIHKRKAFKVELVDTVGSGDSMVAGFLVGAERDYDYALLLGSACGSATAALSTLATREKIEELLARA